MCLSCKDIARQSCAMVRRWLFLATFLHPAFPASRVQHASDLHLKFALRPHHVWKYDKPRDYDDMTSWQIKSWLLDCGIIHQARVYHGYLVTRRSVTELTRHRASTNMYSLTFSRSFALQHPPQYGRSGTAHAAGASILSLAMRSVWHCVRRAVAWRITATHF